MFTVSASVPINDGIRPNLTPDQVWDGLVHHARTGDERFVPPGHHFEIIENREHEVLRRVLLVGNGQSSEHLQWVTFHGGHVMAMSSRRGPLNIRVVSIEADERGEYLMRITMTGEMPGAKHASREERELAVVREDATRASARRFLDAIRQLVENGEI